MPRKRKSQALLKSRFFWVGFGLAFAIVLVIGVAYYLLFRSNILPREKPQYVYIPTGSNYNDVLRILKQDQLLADAATFDFIARTANYPQVVKPGRYLVPESGVGNLGFVLTLKRGLQMPLQLTLTPTRTVKDLCKNLGKQLEAPADSFYELLADEKYVQDLGFTQQTVMAMFLPNNYEVYWNVKPRAFLRRMKQEYTQYWTADRKEKAAALNLTPIQVSVLASIVEAETYRNEERARIAGVYLNRLRLGMKLQADPTVIFANNDFTIRRVLNRHLELDSPYNTYKYTGLPPGPINCPAMASIEAVLNAEQHEYLYFAAKPDFSGYHTFNKTLASHEASANQYRNALTQQQRKRNGR
jgi:UPF0755 protein